MKLPIFITVLVNKAEKIANMECFGCTMQSFVQKMRVNCMTTYPIFSQKSISLLRKLLKPPTFMKKILFLFALLAATSCTLNAANKVNITRIDPTDWYVGMKNPSLQLMVYGKGIRDAQSVTTDYPGVVIDSLVRLDSPNYLLVYLNLKAAKPGTMKLTFQVKNEKGKVKSEVVNYQLKAREMSGDKRKGFDISDVLYLLMPDRFAQGSRSGPVVHLPWLCLHRLLPC